MAQPVSSSRSGKSKRLCAPRLSVRKLAKQPFIRRFHQVIQFQALNALGVKIHWKMFMQTGIFQTLTITFNCSSPFAIASPSRKTEKFVSYITAALYESPPDLHRYDYCSSGSDDPECSTQTRWRGDALFGDRLLPMQTRCTTKDHQVSQQRVAAQRRLAPCTDTQAISPTANSPGTTTSSPFYFVHRQRLTGSFQSELHGTVVTGWDNRNRLFHRINVSEGTGRLGYPAGGIRELLAQVVRLQFRVAPTDHHSHGAFTDFDHDGTHHGPPGLWRSAHNAP